MASIVINVIAILFGFFGVCYTEEKGRIMFYVFLVLINGGLLGYNICRVINGIE
jgi:uncharacterized membrane protein YtjA (UPF0391 family)